MDNEEYEGKTIPLAYHEMCQTRHHREKKWLIIGWVITVAIFAYMWLQYDYTSTTTTTTETTGVYVIYDSEGNVIASDLTPEDVIHIMETLNGYGEENQHKD